MKKILAFSCAIIMACSLTTVAFAAPTTSGPNALIKESILVEKQEIEKVRTTEKALSEQNKALNEQCKALIKAKTDGEATTESAATLATAKEILAQIKATRSSFEATKGQVKAILDGNKANMDSKNFENASIALKSAVDIINTRIEKKTEINKLMQDLVTLLS